MGFTWDDVLRLATDLCEAPPAGEPDAGLDEAYDRCVIGRAYYAAYSPVRQLLTDYSVTDPETAQAANIHADASHQDARRGIANYGRKILAYADTVTDPEGQPARPSELCEDIGENLQVLRAGRTAADYELVPQTPVTHRRARNALALATQTVELLAVVRSTG